MLWPFFRARRTPAPHAIADVVDIAKRNAPQAIILVPLVTDPFGLFEIENEPATPNPAGACVIDG